jgi:sorting nexin-41/42
MEAAAKEYEQVIGAGIEKVVRRLIKRYSGISSLDYTNIELSKEYESLGGAYNAFSLNENGGSLPQAIERVGQASDSTYLSIQELVFPSYRK